MRAVADLQRGKAGWAVSLGTWLLAVCLLGTQWLGLTHAIEHRSHAGTTGTTATGFDTMARMAGGIAAGKAAKGAAADHNCTLFDALALSSCAGVAAVPALPQPAPVALQPSAVALPVFLAASSPYQSRAPPAQPV